MAGGRSRTLAQAPEPALLDVRLFECCDELEPHGPDDGPSPAWIFFQIRWWPDPTNSDHSVNATTQVLDVEPHAAADRRCLAPMNCETYAMKGADGETVTIPEGVPYQTRLLAYDPQHPAPFSDHPSLQTPWKDFVSAHSVPELHELQVLMCAGKHRPDAGREWAPYTCEDDGVCSLGPETRAHWCCTEDGVQEGCEEYVHDERAHALDSFDDFQDVGDNLSGLQQKALVSALTVVIVLVLLFCCAVPLCLCFWMGRCCWRRGARCQLQKEQNSTAPLASNSDCPSCPQSLGGKQEPCANPDTAPLSRHIFESLGSHESLFGGGGSTFEHLLRPARSPLHVSEVSHSWTTTAMPTLMTLAECERDTTLAALPGSEIVSVDESSGHDVLNAQLDWLIAYEAGVFLRKYRLNREAPRRPGGQGMVAFATSAINAQTAYAIKFYYDEESFKVERSHCLDPALRAAMPAVEAIVEDEAVRATNYMPAPLDKHPLPPMIITQQGQALNDFIRSSPEEPNYFTCLDVMMQVAQKLECLHEAGVVHRDLKPPNVICLSASKKWSLIDFGCAAKAGEMAPLCYSLPYAPPETIDALEGGEKSVVSDPKADVFALGVMCWELLTGQRFYGNLSEGGGELEVSIQDCLAGRHKLPSEQELPRLIEKRPRAIRAPVLQMLQRRREDRPTVSEVLSRWRHTFEIEKTVMVGSAGDKA